MKERAGFVSNSSSSSFMVTVEDKTQVLQDTYEVIAFLKANPEKDLMIIGPSLSEGMDVFVPDEAMKKFILENSSSILSSYPGWIGLLGYQILEDDHPLDYIPGRYFEVDSFVLPFDAKKGTVFISLLKDYGASETVEDLKKRYL